MDGAGGAGFQGGELGAGDELAEFADGEAFRAGAEQAGRQRVGPRYESVFDCASGAPRPLAVQDPFARLVERASAFQLEAAGIPAGGEDIII
jgi:hypothetical protein